MSLPEYAPPKDLLTQHTILVTGAAHGIGRAASKAFASHGATVILLDKDIPALESLYDEITTNGLPEPAIYPMDMAGANLDDFATMEETLSKNFKCLHGLLHNAAQLGSLTPITEYDPKLWQTVMNINLNTPLFITRSCLPLLKAADTASLLFTSDKVGRKGKAYWGAYGISKFAIEGLMETLADELETNTQIRVNSLDPGPVRTNMRSVAYPAEAPEKSCLPEQLMSTYLYLMGKDSSEIHGQRLTLQS